MEDCVAVPDLVCPAERQLKRKIKKQRKVCTFFAQVIFGTKLFGDKLFVRTF